MVEANFSLDGEALPADSVLVGFRGSERISEPYAFDLFVTASDGGALEDMVGTRLGLLFRRPDGRAVRGVVREVEILEEHAARAIARLELVPRFALLALSHHSRVFTDEKIPAIIEKILADADFGPDDYELRLDGTYEAEEHVCQYRESDLDFVCRWLEHEGIHYYFEHGEQREKLVLRDGPVDAALGSGQVRYHAGGAGDRSAGDALFAFRARHVRRAQRVRLGDYDYLKPSLEVSGEAAALEGGMAEVVSHSEDRFLTPARGAALARVRAEALMSSQAVFQASGRDFQLQAGYCFDLEGHPVARLNARYRCTGARHRGVAAATTAEVAALTGLTIGENYAVECDAILASLPFRPARRTPKPRLDGYAVAVVDGPADSEYAQLDAEGRYRVVLGFDESGLANGKASAALRMMQPHAGNPEGMHFPLRKGTEVLVAFREGDPDRPLIAGAVPNAVTPSPVTSANDTKNVIHTGGNNRIEIEDQDGSQWITISTPTKKTHLHLGLPFAPASHHLELKTDGNCLFDIGSNQDITVGAKLTETVTGAVKETYSASQTSDITGPKKSTVTKDGCFETYGSTHKTTVLGAVTETYQAGQDTTVDAAKRAEFFLSSQTTTVNAAPVEQIFYDSHFRAVSGAANNTLAGEYTRHASGSTLLRYGSNVTRLWGPVTREYASIDWTVEGTTTILCGHQNLAAPNSLWSHLGSHKAIGLMWQSGLLVIAGGTIKLQFYAAYLSRINDKYEAAGAMLSLNGLKSTTGVTHGHSRFGVKWHFPKAASNHT